MIVAGTRDCSLQRRFQKLVEEAPAPFLSDEQRRRIYEAAESVCKEAGYGGVGTVEFLVGGDGVISFLEVNTRLQVEHPVTEEVTGIDLVEEQFRIASGDVLSVLVDPPVTGHSIEFRITAEDPKCGFMPSPGFIARYLEPSGPGVRIDSSVVQGDIVGDNYDSLLAKGIVTGRDRQHALARARRALAEFEIEGPATVLPFHRNVVEHRAFASTDGIAIHTRWVESEWSGELVEGIHRQTKGNSTFRTQLRRSGATNVEVPDAQTRDAVRAPMRGTVIKLVIQEGQHVESGDLLFVLEAMKMEIPVIAHKAGTIRGLAAEVAVTAEHGAVLAEISSQ